MISIRIHTINTPEDNGPEEIELAELDEERVVVQLGGTCVTVHKNDLARSIRAICCQDLDLTFPHE